jgi:hypothetical protein
MFSNQKYSLIFTNINVCQVAYVRWQETLLTGSPLGDIDPCTLPLSEHQPSVFAFFACLHPVPTRTTFLHPSQFSVHHTPTNSPLCFHVVFPWPLSGANLLYNPMFLLAPCSSCCLLHAGFFLDLPFNLEGRSNMLVDFQLTAWRRQNTYPVTETSPAGFEVLTMVTTNSTIFWDVTSCSMVEVLRSSFGRTYCFHLQGQRVRQASSGSSF